MAPSQDQGLMWDRMFAEPDVNSVKGNRAPDFTNQVLQTTISKACKPLYHVSQFLVTTSLDLVDNLSLGKPGIQVSEQYQLLMSNLLLLGLILTVISKTWVHILTVKVCCTKIYKLNRKALIIVPFMLKWPTWIWIKFATLVSGLKAFL